MCTHYLEEHHRSWKLQAQVLGQLMEKLLMGSDYRWQHSSPQQVLQLRT